MSGQSKRASLVEALANIAVGISVGFTSNIIVLPLFGLAPPLLTSFYISLVFSAISLARSYIIRRVFNGFTTRTKT